MSNCSPATIKNPEVHNLLWQHKEIKLIILYLFAPFKLTKYMYTWKYGGGCIFDGQRYVHVYTRNKFSNSCAITVD